MVSACAASEASASVVPRTMAASKYFFMAIPLGPWPVKYDWRRHPPVAQIPRRAPVAPSQSIVLLIPGFVACRKPGPGGRQRTTDQRRVRLGAATGDRGGWGLPQPPP